MTHRQIRHLGAYLEDELDPRTREDVAQHLAACSDCANELHALRRTVQLLRDLPKPAPPPDLTQAVMARLQATETQPGFTRRVADWLSTLAPTAWGPPLATAGLGLGVLVMLQLQGPGAPLLLSEGLTTAPAVAELREVRAPVQPVELADLSQASDVGRSTAGEALASFTRLPKAASFSAEPKSLPQLESCLEPVRSPAACAHAQSRMVALARTDARAFQRELERLPMEQREPMLARLQDFAARAGSAPLLSRALRQSSAAVLAPQLEAGAPQDR